MGYVNNTTELTPRSSSAALVKSKPDWQFWTKCAGGLCCEFVCFLYNLRLATLAQFSQLWDGFNEQCICKDASCGWNQPYANDGLSWQISCPLTSTSPKKCYFVKIHQICLGWDFLFRTASISQWTHADGVTVKISTWKTKANHSRLDAEGHLSGTEAGSGAQLYVRRAPASGKVVRCVPGASPPGPLSSSGPTPAGEAAHLSFSCGTTVRGGLLFALLFLQAAGPFLPGSQNKADTSNVRNQGPQSGRKLVVTECTCKVASSGAKPWRWGRRDSGSSIITVYYREGAGRGREDGERWDHRGAQTSLGQRCPNQRARSLGPQDPIKGTHKERVSWDK